MEEAGNQVGKWGEGQGRRICRLRKSQAASCLGGADPAGWARGERLGGGGRAGSRARTRQNERGTRGSQ